MRRYVDLVRNFKFLVSADRYAIPSPSFLSSWYWHRKEHQTRLELHSRLIQPPVAPPQAVFREPLSSEPRRPLYPNAGNVLYKYVSDRWARDLFLRGETRLSSAGYYGRLEGDEARQDDELQKRNSLFGQTVTVTSADGRNIPVIGDVSVAHHGPDYYMFCVACDWDARLFDEFDVDRCVVITNTDAFADRIRSATAEKLDGWHFHHNPVEYFDPMSSTWAVTSVTRWQRTSVLPTSASTGLSGCVCREASRGRSISPFQLVLWATVRSCGARAVES